MMKKQERKVIPTFEPNIKFENVKDPIINKSPIAIIFYNQVKECVRILEETVERANENKETNKSFSFYIIFIFYEMLIKGIIIDEESLTTNFYTTKIKSLYPNEETSIQLIGHDIKIFLDRFYSENPNIQPKLYEVLKDLKEEFDNFYSLLALCNIDINELYCVDLRYNASKQSKVVIKGDLKLLSCEVEYIKKVVKNYNEQILPKISI